MTSTEKLDQLAQALLDRHNLMTTHLHTIILEKAKNGGFCLEEIWRIKDLQAYPYREIVGCAAKLEDKGILNYNAETFTYTLREA